MNDKGKNAEKVAEYRYVGRDKMEKTQNSNNSGSPKALVFQGSYMKGMVYNYGEQSGRIYSSP